MSDTPAFLDSGRPPVPDLVVPRGVLPFFLPNRPVRGRLVRLGPLTEALLSPARQPPCGHRTCRAGAGARRRFVHRAQISRLVQPASEGRRAGFDAAGRLHRCRGTARLCHRQPDKLAALLARDPSPSAEALLGGLPRVHRRSGRRAEPPPGHRRDRGRFAGGNGAALLRHQRAVALSGSAGLRANRGRLARRRADPGKSRRRGRIDPALDRRRRRKAGTPRRCSTGR